MKSTKGKYILLGSNLGDRKQVLEDTRELISKMAGTIIQASSLYETEPWGVSNQPSFYNQVLELDTLLAPQALLECLQTIERRIGKIKLGKWRERLIDIDLLYYDQYCQEDEQLTLPHPEIQNRRFTLVPMCQLNPDFMHPVLHKPQKELLATCSDRLQVWPVSHEQILLQ